MSESDTDDIWLSLLPGRQERGEAFTQIVKSDTRAKVLSIEAGFGQGKTTFRKAWAEHLRRNGETVIEFDAWKTDHSDDPLIAFVGSLMSALPESLEESKLKRAQAAGKKIAAVGAKTLLHAVLRNGANEVIEAVSANVSVESEADKLIETADKIGGEMSKAAANMIAAQMFAEETRQKTLPAQLEILRESLQGGEDGTGRIIVIIDELDRCRPDYAVSLLEAIKHLFDQDGYIFVLMLNPEQLARTAERLFGKAQNGEPYFTKFLDLRLKLADSNEQREWLCSDLATALTYQPINSLPIFSSANVSNVSSALISVTELTFRQIESIFTNVDLAIRCSPAATLDVTYLIFLAVRRALEHSEAASTAHEELKNTARDIVPACQVSISDARLTLEHLDKQRSRTSPDEMEKMVERYGPFIGKGWSEFKEDGRAFWSEVISFMEDFHGRHERLIDGVAALRADE